MVEVIGTVVVGAEVEAGRSGTEDVVEPTSSPEHADTIRPTTRTKCNRPGLIRDKTLNQSRKFSDQPAQINNSGVERPHI